jgi:hypothetical protein
MSKSEICCFTSTRLYKHVTQCAEKWWLVGTRFPPLVWTKLPVVKDTVAVRKSGESRGCAVKKIYAVNPA